MRVGVRLDEATPISGGLLFSVLTDPLPPVPGWKRSRQSHQTRGRDDRRGGGGGGKKFKGKKRR